MSRVHWLASTAHRLLSGGRSTGADRPPGAPSLTRMLGQEVAIAARSALRVPVVGSALLSAVAIALVLGPTTPGPVLDGGYRVGAAAFLGLLALAIAQRLLRRRQVDTALRGAAVVVATTTVVMVGTLVTALLLAVMTGGTLGQAASTRTPVVVEPALLRGSVLLVLAVFAAKVGDRLAWPVSLLVLGVGMLLGDDGLDLVSLDDPILVQSIGVVVLVVVLFDGGIGTTAERLRLGLGPGLSLATIGVGVTTAVAGVGLSLVGDVDLRLALLVAAIVSSTDASAVFGVLRQVRAPKRLDSVLTVESGVNDPVAVLLTVGLITTLQAADPPGGWLAFGATQLIGGLCVGVAGGWAVAALLRAGGVGDRTLRALLALAGAGVTYGVAAAAGGSGFLAVYVCGIVVAADPRAEAESVRSTVDTFARTGELALFLMLGLLVFPADLPPFAGTGLLLAAILLLVARPLAVVVSLAGFRLPVRELAAVSWLGMRGPIPIVLATLAFSAGLPSATVIFDLVFFVVAISTLVQGVTALPVLRRLGLVEAAPAGDVAPVGGR